MFRLFLGMWNSVVAAFPIFLPALSTILWKNIAKLSTIELSRGVNPGGDASPQ